MKDLLIDFEDMKAGEKALRKIAQAFTRAGAPVASTDVDPKAKRSSGVTYRDANLTFTDNQKIVLSVKSTGDIFQVRINGSVVPLKNQEDQRKAVAELVKHLDAGRAKFQQKLARVKAELPKGVRATAPKVEVALQQRSEQLDAEIAQAREQIDALKAELGAAPSAPAAENPARRNAFEQAIATYVRGGGNEQDGRRILEEEISKVSAMNLPSSLVHWGFATARNADRIAAELSGKALDSVNLDEARELAESILGGAILDSAGMDHALATLQIALDAAENNAPIHEAEGNADQAELCRNVAASCRDAIAMLDSADEGEDESEEDDEPNEDQGSLFDEAEEEVVEPNPDQDSLFDAVPASVGNKLAEIGKTYWASIPLDKIFAAVQAAGYEPVDEDGEPWEGMLTGREGRAVIDLQKAGKRVKEALALQWYKMASGKFKVNAYVS